MFHSHAFRFGGAYNVPLHKAGVAPVILQLFIGSFLLLLPCIDVVSTASAPPLHTSAVSVVGFYPPQDVELATEASRPPASFRT